MTNQLLDQKIKIKIYDPMVQKERILEDLKLQLESSGKSNKEIKKLVSQITICKDAYIALKNVNFAAICTEWDEFKSYDWNKYIIT